MVETKQYAFELKNKQGFIRIELKEIISKLMRGFGYVF